MALLTIQQPNADGLTMASAAAGGDQYPNDRDTVLIVHNTGTAVRTVTATIRTASAFKENFGDLTTTSVALAVTADAKQVLQASPGGFSGTDGRVTLTYSSEADLEIAAVRLNRL